MDSPPKRMTRARAAAKATEPSTKTTKIVTAAARAKTTATGSTKSTAAKRKTRADENDESDAEDEEAPARRVARGRPKKMTEPQETSRPAPVKATRGRPPRKAVAESALEEAAAPVKPARGRPRKAPAPVEDDLAPGPRKTTQSRAGPVTKPNSAVSKPTVKKSVKFEEPNKENMMPTEDNKEQPSSTGLRGRPPRKTPSAGVQRTKAASRSDASQKKPLSPRKVTQMPLSKDESSEDELAGDDYKPRGAMVKGPIKPPKGVIAKKKEPASIDKENKPANANNPSKSSSDDAIMASPPKRPPISPTRDALKSPAKRMAGVPLPGSAMKPISYSDERHEQTPGFKASLLQSAVKRPLSPIKGLTISSASKPQSSLGNASMKLPLFQSPAKRAMPGLKSLSETRDLDVLLVEESPSIKPLTASTTMTDASKPSHKLMAEDKTETGTYQLEDDGFNGIIEKPRFSGRLSAVLPRLSDPSLDIVGDGEIELKDAQIIMPKIVHPFAGNMEAETAADIRVNEDAVSPLDDSTDPMGFDEVVAEMEESTELPPLSIAKPKTTSQPENPMFQLRQRDLDFHGQLGSDSESEDEQVLVGGVPTTPTPSGQKASIGRASSLSLSRATRRSTMGFTSLAEQFDAWQTASPIKDTCRSTYDQSVADGEIEAAAPTSPDETAMTNEFFDDEMLVHADPPPKETISTSNSANNEDEDVDFDDIMVTGEDIALALEANEMSLMEPEQEDGNINLQSIDDSLSEASQEYGDENEIPTASATQNVPPHEPVTPLRPMQKSFNTTTKVPLKPADHSTLSPLKKRSFSASRVAPRRPSGISRSATVISYSPMKERRKSSHAPREHRRSSSCVNPPVTPAKSDAWSLMGTPARTPRKDINPALLRGAVVFVDVHTSEGADASGIFVELLGQMGARCIKSWHWNPSSPSSRDSSTKVGITHVVYKDGGKRTLEKVRETNGVVQCVGVSWVLDCERENEWLDEAPYYIDTALVPRGGARRRKSMEPQALANMNGTLVRSPSKAAPSTPNRRQSSVWMYTPSDQGDGDHEDDDDVEWSKFILTPVPKTPAPEAIARFAAEGPETPSDGSESGFSSSPTKQILMQTCPPKANPYRDMGEGLLRNDKDEQVLMRLMAARRKSLQFAPKIGSPLSKAWGL